MVRMLGRGAPGGPPALAHLVQAAQASFVLRFHLHTFSRVAGLYGLYWEGGPLGPADPRGYILHLCSKNLSEETPCSAVAVLSLPSSLSASSRMKFSRHSFLPVLDLEI